MANDTVNEKKGSKMYAGEDRRVGDFSRKVMLNLPVQVARAEVPRIQTQYGMYGGGKLPSKFMLVEIQNWDYGHEGVLVTYLPYKKRAFEELGRLAVPVDFVFRVLTGRMGQEMREKYEVFRFEHLYQQLNYGGSIGSDPEIFVEDREGGVIPAFRFLKDKAHADRAKGHGCHGENSIYWDGFQAEMDTWAGTCLAYHVDSVHYGLQGIWERARVYREDAKLSIQTVMEIPLQELLEGREEHVSFGCMPSLNVYGFEGEKRPCRELSFRSAGGHIHFGIGARSMEKDREEIFAMVKALDAVLAVSCTSLFAKFDHPLRRKFYGLPGEFRLPKHGLEYRVLSNAWLMHPLIMNLVFDLGRKALVFGQRGLLPYWKGSEEETIEVVKGCDVPRAREILTRNKDVLLQMFRASYGDRYYDPDTGKPIPWQKDAERIFQIFFDGAESVIADPTDFVRNWKLDGEWTTHSNGEGANWANARKTILAGGKV